MQYLATDQEGLKKKLLMVQKRVDDMEGQIGNMN